MVRRIAFAVVAIPLVVAIVWYGGWPLTLLLVAACGLGVDEFYRLAGQGGARPLRRLGGLLAMLMPIAFLAIAMLPLEHWLAQGWTFGVLMLLLVLIGASVFTHRATERPIESMAITLFGVAYCGVLPTTLFFIRHAHWGAMSWAGTALVFFPLVVTWVCDSAAMLGGQMIGGPKLAPTISPGKTRAGGIAGLVGGTAVGAVFALFVFPRVSLQVDLLAAMLLAFALSVIGQIGDLAESLFKREAGVKDSSALIPGHGGVLDRLDSLYFAIPAAAIGFHVLGII